MDKLIGSVTSPYVRKLRLLFTQLNINHEFESINYMEEKDSQYLKKINPINKIPILLIRHDHSEEVLYDSRVIYNYLAKKYHLRELTLHEENIYSAIDAALDTSINLFALRRGGLDINSGNSYIERQKERVPLILNFLSPWVKGLSPNNPEHWNILTMSLYSYLFWGNFREILSIEQFPEMQQFLKDFADKPGINETRPI